MIRQNFKSFFILTALILQLACSQTTNTTQHIEIYGVRWFLGEHFKFSPEPPLQSSEHYVLMFNSDDKLEGDLSLVIAGNKFTCSTNPMSTEAVAGHHQDFNANTTEIGQILKTYIHKCIVGDMHQIANNLTLREIKYQIVLGNLLITQSKNITIRGYEENILYSGVFRIPVGLNVLEALVIGDWGQITSIGQKKGYDHVMPCLVKKLEQNKNVVMMIFTGDLAYDLQGPLYYSMLKHIQVITSKIVFMVTPGNHDTLYHADTFELFTETFYSPNWKHYYNYYYTMQFGNVVFISYNPEREAYDYHKDDRIKIDLAEIFKKELTPAVTKKLNQSYFSIVFSHYPIFCSNIYDDIQSCEKNDQRLSVFRQYFKNISMKLYISGHLHLYERTKPICPDNTFPQKISNNFSIGCPVYIVEGAGGNNDYIQTKETYPPKNISAKLVYNTGFGILRLNNIGTSTPTNVTYEHFSSSKCEISDKFQMTTSNVALPPNNNIPSTSDSNAFTVTLYKIVILGMGVAVLVGMGVYMRYRYKKRPLLDSRQPQNQNQHMEMVEQHFQGPQSSEPNDAPESDH